MMEKRKYVNTGVRVLPRATDDKPATITGIAALYYDGTPNSEFDFYGHFTERIMPGAFDRAIREDDVRALFNHNENLILGRTRAGTLRLSSEPTGLGYSVDVPDTSAGRDVATSIERGDVTGSSFSFIATDSRWLKVDEVDIREIISVRLLDVSPVTYPAYENTSVGMKSLNGGGDDPKASAAYQEWQATRSAAAAAVDIRVQAFGRTHAANLITLPLTEDEK